MKFFLDSSVLLAASGSSQGASRWVLDAAGLQGWTLLTSFYCWEEAHRNLGKLSDSARLAFHEHVVPSLDIISTSLVLDRPLVFPQAKDRPVVVSALAMNCEVFLTLDRADFQGLLGSQIYGMAILTPGDWLRRWKESATQ